MSETKTHTFDAEVRQLLDLVIHSLYSEREVFLRELISNASDALDKARVVGLQEEGFQAAAGEPRIDVSVDTVNNTITLSDNGVGLTEDEAIAALGTIAHSGTKAFAQALKEQEHNLIGQFGVGFYAAFMVADRVQVRSLSGKPGATPILWECDGSTEYTVTAAERGDRGTDIILHLREDAQEFADEDRLRDIIKRYSEFVSYPIFVAEEQANEPKALWTRSPSEVEDDEYKAFYKQLTGDFQDPASHLHWSADAPLQYKALLFLPAAAPYDLNHADGRRDIKLYARRVLIDDQASFLVPDYLRFVRGVVDTEDLQLNVSREMVQQTAVVDKLQSALTSKVLRHLVSLAKKQPETYETLWANFGAVLKEGLHNVSSSKDKERLTTLVRFNSTRHDDPSGQVSLAQYVEAMGEDQDEIYYLVGPDHDSVKRSPHLEAFKRKGVEVLLSWDTVDEWALPSLAEFEGKKLVSISRGEVDLGEDEQSEPTAQVSEDLTTWIQQVLAGEVSKVRSSKRLTASASVLVDDEYGVSNNMQRIMQQLNQSLPASMRILEINPSHDLVRTLDQLHKDGRASEAEPLAWLLLDQARLVEGEVRDPAGLVQRLQTLSALAAQALGVSAEQAPHPEPAAPTETADAPVVIEGEILDADGQQLSE
ncbi:MAG: molecular chaperone HtpG [Myxococcota bacterium]|nr:molecular chaperone HtpG [Myxococcota bacterium]